MPPRSRTRGKPPTFVAPPATLAPSVRRGDPRRYIYAGLDFGLAALHAIIAVLGPTRHASGRFLMWAIVGAFAVAGAATLFRHLVAWRVACGALMLLLVVEATLLVVIVASAAYLSGVFGAFGRGAASMALVAGFISLQTVALVPALQLKYSLTRAGRRAFGVEPA